MVLAAGFVDGRGWGDNAKAAVMRVGLNLMDMVQFGKEFFGETVHTATFTEESAGVADLITSCSGGRNFRCAKLAVQKGVPVEEVERSELNGQKLQATTTAMEVNSFLKARGQEKKYPLFPHPTRPIRSISKKNGAATAISSRRPTCCRHVVIL